MPRKTLLLCLLAVVSCGLLQAGDNPTKKRIEGWRQNARAATSLIQASIKCDVKPKDAQVFMDGSLVGVARDFNSSDHPLFVFAGEHTLEFRHPGHETYSTKISLLPEQDLHVKVRMNKLK